MATVALAVLGCESVPIFDLDEGIDTQQGRAEQDASGGRHASAARRYERLAVQSEPVERNHFLILAAEAYRAIGDMPRVRSVLARIGSPVAETDQPRLILLTAAADLDQGDAQRAMDRLDELADPVPDPLLAEVLSLQAQALYALDQPVEATKQLIQRETVLSDEQATLDNQWMIWNGIQRSTVLLPGEIAIAEIESDPVMAGWLRLGLIAQQVGRNPFGVGEALGGWRQQHQGHPASGALLDGLLARYRSLVQYPQRLALLLPLSGRLKSSGGAVQDGFLAAYYAHRAEQPDIDIRVYDTSAVEPLVAYTQALFDGAEFVVGPLTKDAVSRVANEAGVTPTLALNYLAAEAGGPPGFYQFAPAPEDEARAAAIRAIEDGHVRAVALVPDNDWGTRLLRSFTTQFEALGGRLLNFRPYATAEQDFTIPIRRLLMLDDSFQRRRQVAADLRVPLEFEPRRRQDVQFVFMAAQPNQARLLKTAVAISLCRRSAGLCHLGDLPTREP